MSLKREVESEHIDFSLNDWKKKTHNLILALVSYKKLFQKLMQKSQNSFKNKRHTITHLGTCVSLGAEESYFAYQVDRYACIYMEKLLDLFQCSPLSYLEHIGEH